VQTGQPWDLQHWPGTQGKGLRMHTVTKKELVDRIAERTGAKNVLVKKIVQSFLDDIIGELSHGNRLEFRDFGVFESRERAARIAQNPKTLERVEVPAKRTVRFKLGRRMKQELGIEEEGGAETATEDEQEEEAPQAQQPSQTQPH
jgi:integration host factor subunit beta